jgi:hypothetical protein
VADPAHHHPAGNHRLRPAGCAWYLPIASRDPRVCAPPGAAAAILTLIIFLGSLQRVTMPPREMLKIVVQAVLLSLLISIIGSAWIDYTVPGAWPDLIGPSEPGSG